MPGVTLFADQVGDATSTVVGRVRRTIGNSRIERILVKGSGTWSGATVRFQVSEDNVNFQHLTDEKGYAIGLYGDDFASLLDLPSGIYFRVVIADSESPQSSLTIKAFGDVVSV
jgi:hypothetical protein